MTIDWKRLCKSLLACAICGCFFILVIIVDVLFFDPRADYGGPPTTVLQKLTALSHPHVMGAMLMSMAVIGLVLCCTVLPLQLILKKFRLNHWLPFLLVGAAAGLVLAALGANGEDLPLLNPQSVLPLLDATMTISLFWLIRRPDKDSQPMTAAA